jgi:hypothetical protein
MKPITTAEELKQAIQILEAEHALKGQQLKEHLLLSYESLKPANLIKGALSEVASTPDLIDNIWGTTFGLASGYLSKMIVVAGSGSRFRKLLGVILQLGVTNVVAQHSGTIKSIGQFIYQRFLGKKEANSEKP